MKVYQNGAVSFFPFENGWILQSLKSYTDVVARINLHKSSFSANAQIHLTNTVGYSSKVLLVSFYN